jgi:lipoprotein-releasing system permease protein
MLEEELGYPYIVKSWEEMNANLFSALKLERVVIIIVFSLIVLVSSFNIIGTLVMMILERKRDISVLKAVGASRGFIMRIFLISGCFLGLGGTALGIFLGSLITVAIGRWNLIPLDPEIYFVARLPVELSLVNAGIIGGISILIALCASCFPAFQASRVFPTDGLRYE